jgi:hypothetical protein
MALIGIPDCHDSRSPDDLAGVADQIIGELARDLKDRPENSA